ncbi:prepilin-type N-terminal cleavage/methylation domain-containing protein [Clostridium cochlearium]|uniref:Prepilin-type N-terminal cleavage/methylation domain-containing protein n=1 Tax=Clostridium cochlearium TaxID=1494 RepID=A0A7Y3XXE4_CLOCO|nr:prepilin-type N-terminal cleavage/methylation domain-containing protein [Clostridium cochlearium]NOH15261.1 prepilin-type N-terminal cleavage/methylation domain-containing protein [Clostridium cochlearium]
MIKALSEKLKKKKKGFTLIELIIVIAIIAIIAGFAIPNFIKVRNNAKIDADINLGRTIAQAVEVMTVDGTIGADKKITFTVGGKGELSPEGENREDAEKIQGYIKEGTLKLQAKDAKGSLVITIDSEGKVTLIEASTAEGQSEGQNKLYPEPSGIFEKNKTEKSGDN